MTMSEVGGDKPPAPPLSPPMKKRRSGRKGKGVVVVEGGDGGGGGRAKIGNHILNERERRKKMNDKFSTLHHLLPHIPTKSNRSSIIGEATRYIKKLQVILQDGERQKLERVQNGVVENLTSKVEISTGESSNNNNNNNKDRTLIVSSDFGPVFETWSWPNVVLNMCGEYGQFSVCTLKKPNILSSISFLFEQFKLDVVNCNINISNQSSYMYMFLTQVMRNGSSTDHLELPTAAEVLEIFKRAAAEISYWLSS
ncbi:transcription factor bHLH95-like [Impatiens glandulifera]|uniref:transcription factor bHLH95-like n=1 Tax=Impatiens glandulifera TaxID=253017 RepID=UPI001FB19986|nr:transcription factor bHLH95-like [Impatiens glandulifera]